LIKGGTNRGPEEKGRVKRKEDSWYAHSVCKNPRERTKATGGGEKKGSQATYRLRVAGVGKERRTATGRKGRVVVSKKKLGDSGTKKGSGKKGCTLGWTLCLFPRLNFKEGHDRGKDREVPGWQRVKPGE